METQQISIRINLDSREFEIKGDIKYIDSQYGSYIKECLDIIKSSTNTRSSDSNRKSESNKKEGPNETIVGGTVDVSFGEFLNKYSKTLSNVDKLLLACYFIQTKNGNKSFTVSEANALLIDQGIKLSNPAVFNKNNAATKKVFKISGNNFKVSDIGVSHIQSL